MTKWANVECRPRYIFSADTCHSDIPEKRKVKGVREKVKRLAPSDETIYNIITALANFGAHTNHGGR